MHRRCLGFTSWVWRIGYKGIIIVFLLKCREDILQFKPFLNEFLWFKPIIESFEDRRLNYISFNQTKVAPKPSWFYNWSQNSGLMHKHCHSALLAWEVILQLKPLRNEFLKLIIESFEDRRQIFNIRFNSIKVASAPSWFYIWSQKQQVKSISIVILLCWPEKISYSLSLFKMNSYDLS